MSLKQLIPESIKAALRPAYRKYIHGINQDRNSGVQIARFENLDFAYRPATTDEVILGNLTAYKIDTLIPGSCVRPFNVVVNIGAHIGAFALLAAQSAAKVYAIEPANDTFNLLRINAALNRANNISLHKMAIADKDSPCTLYFDTGHWGHSITKQLSTRTETVRGATLTTFFSENNIDRCDFMFLNCEGAEFPILLNSPNSTLRKIGIILADCHPHLWPHNSIKELVSRLTEAGFQTSLLEFEGSYDRVLAVSHESASKHSEGRVQPISKPSA